MDVNVRAHIGDEEDGRMLAEHLDGDTFTLDVKATGYTKVSVFCTIEQLQALHVHLGQFLADQ